MMDIKRPKTVKVGSLILGRGSPYQYPTERYIDRSRSDKGVGAKFWETCLPCCLPPRAKIISMDTESGEQVDLWHYVTTLEHVLWKQHHLEDLNRRKTWKYLSSGLSLFCIQLTVLLICILKVLVETVQLTDAVFTAFELILAILCVSIRTFEILFKYWRAQLERQKLEVCDYVKEDFQQSLPKSLYYCIISYFTSQICMGIIILICGVTLTSLDLPQWTLITTLIPLFGISELSTGILHRRLDEDAARVQQDHLKLTLFEAVDILENIRVPETKTSQEIYTFKTAVRKTFDLNRFGAPHIRV